MKLPSRVNSLKGLTFMELLWVMAIMAAVFSLAVPHFTGPLNEMALEKKVREIYMALAYSQRQAVNQNKTFGVFFDTTPGQQKVTCYQNNGYDGSSGEPIIGPNNILLNLLTKKPYVIWVNEEGEYGDRTLEANFNEKTWVEFDPLGIPEGKGTVLLANNYSSHTITVSQIGRLDFE